MVWYSCGPVLSYQGVEATMTVPWWWQQWWWQCQQNSIRPLSLYTLQPLSPNIHNMANENAECKVVFHAASTKARHSAERKVTDCVHFPNCNWWESWKNLIQIWMWGSTAAELCSVYNGHEQEKKRVRQKCLQMRIFFLLGALSNHLGKTCIRDILILQIRFSR